MISARFAPILFGFILSGLMSCLVSGVSTFFGRGYDAEFWSVWMSGWLPSWFVSFPAVLVVAPVTRRLVARLVDDDEAGAP